MCVCQCTYVCAIFFLRRISFSFVLFHLLHFVQIYIFCYLGFFFVSHIFFLLVLFFNTYFYLLPYFPDLHFQTAHAMNASVMFIEMVPRGLRDRSSVCVPLKIDLGVQKGLVLIKSQRLVVVVDVNYINKERTDLCEQMSLQTRLCPQFALETEQTDLYWAICSCKSVCSFSFDVFVAH